MSLRQLGNIYRFEGALNKSLKEYARAVAILEAVSSSDQSNKMRIRDLTLAYNSLGLAHRLTGNADEARRLFRMALSLRVDLVRSDPNNLSWKRDMTFSWNLIGDLARQEGRNAEAFESYNRAFEARKEIVSKEPTVHRWRRDLAVSWENVGDMKLLDEDYEEARIAFQESFEIRQSLATMNEYDLKRQRDKATSLRKLGEVEHLSGDPEAARVFYLQSAQIMERLVASYPSTVAWLDDMATLKSLFAKSYEVSDDLPSAIKHQTDAIDYRGVVLKLSPKDVKMQALSVKHYGYLALLLKSNGAVGRAREICREIELESETLESSMLEVDAKFENTAIQRLSNYLEPSVIEFGNGCA
ncbi:MAG: tetratricopeptide repeat protein [Pseudomonadota bacterium]